MGVTAAIGWGALGFAVGGAFVPGILAPSASPKWWAIAVGVPLISSLDPRRLSPAVLICLSATILWAVALVPSTPYPPGAALEVYLLLLLGLVAVAGAAAEPDEVNACLAGAGWGVALSSPVVVLQRLGYNPVDLAVGPAGLFLNPEVLALAAAPLFAWAAWGARYLLAAAILPALVLSGSRTGALAAALGLLACHRGSIWVKLGFLLGIALAGAAALAGFGVERAATASTRIALWGAAWLSMTWGGRGPGWWGQTHPKPYEDFVHSDALQAMVELGVGAAFLIAVPVLVLWRRDGEALGDTGARGAFVAVLVAACVSFPLHAPTTGFVAFLLAGHLARRRRDVRGVELRGGVDHRVRV